MKAVRILVSAACLFGGVVHSEEQGSAEPNELVSLRKNWEQARKQALDPIDRKYLNALQLLKGRFTKDGKLNEAVAIDKEIKLIEDKKSSGDESSKPLTETLEGSRWANIRGHEVIIFKNKKLFWSTTNIATNGWDLIKESDLELDFKFARTGAVAKLKFSKDLNEFVTSDGDRTFAREK